MYACNIFYTLNINLKLSDLDGYSSPTNVYMYISIKCILFNEFDL